MPERYSGPSEYRLAGRLLCIWIANSAMPHGSWSIFREAWSDGYVVRRLIIEGAAEQVYCDEAPIGKELVESILASFEALQVPAFRRPTRLGLDGGSQGISLGDTWRSTTMEWWSGCEHEWEPLAEACSHARWELEKMFAGNPRSGKYY
ncbi:hypothetical protein ABT364_13005 [Massilia sp. SR12]